MSTARLVLMAASLAAPLSPLGAQDDTVANPFERFVGEWKLKDDRFQQVWDGKTAETISIPGHRTQCAAVNTSQSVLCEVDAVDFRGHIMWAVAADGETVSHLSSFGSSRIGNGVGKLGETGDLSLRIRFADEPPGTFRRYRYRWLSDDEYEMMSVQYTDAGKRTGNWYGGRFVRVARDGS
jgi:hypothetical protein